MTGWVITGVNVPGDEGPWLRAVSDEDASRKLEELLAADEVFGRTGLYTVWFDGTKQYDVPSPALPIVNRYAGWDEV